MSVNSGNYAISNQVELVKITCSSRFVLIDDRSNESIPVSLINKN